MKLGILLALLLTGCSATPKVEPIAGPIAVTVVQAADCYAQSHYLDAGKAERQAAFDKCACEAGHCE
jgi:hypothetical protein